MEHTLSILVENASGVLTRVAGLVARRGFNIESLAVGHTEDPTRSRITLVVDADNEAVKQLTKQLHKLINVYKIVDLTEEPSISRELVLFKVKADAEKRHEVVEVVNLFRAKVVDVTPNTLTVEATGTSDKLQAMEDLFRGYGICEIARTGKIALSRGL